MIMSAAAVASSPIRLTTNIADVPGVGVKRAAAFRKLGIRGISDLILHLPLRYEHDLGEQSIAEAGKTIGPLHGAEASITVRGEVAAARAPLSRRAPYQATLFDTTGTIKLTWFNSPWMKGKLHPGMRIIVSGKCKRHGDYLEMVNPKWQEENESQSTPGLTEGKTRISPSSSAESRSSSGRRGDLGQTRREDRLIPIYSASESLPSSIIHQTIEAALDQALAHLEDHLAPEYRRKAALPELREAYRMVHRPENEDEIKSGRRRLAFDELFLLQLGVMLKRHHRQRTLHAPVLKHSPKIDQHIRARIPFKLTPGQELVVKEIARDVQRPAPMNRLVQGDVGSGKTVVALYAMLMAIASGGQAALMAPTEILAEQHFASITDMLSGARVKIELLTGSLKPAQRRDVQARLESGGIDLLIGTHALLSGVVKFKNLAVAVIDEQHRFGVHQRAHLRAKSADADSSPHILVMTATPIPRTMSLTIFGDLDISTIKGMPPGRKPVITKWVPQAKSRQVYGYVAKRTESSEQAYIVVPVIDESESGLKAVKSHMQALTAGALSRKRLEAMHGRMKREEREKTMAAFRAGEIDALVATTVIEVGVDVPNASIMVIEQADRFGLAQLHQLRGRVGRGEKRSLCVLIADPITDDAKARLEAIVATSDGFQIAEKDLEIRGPGELFGARQSGIAPFQIADFPRDLPLLRMARRDAHAWIARNPTLAGARDALLRKRLLKKYGETLGLGDVA
jgi:ATP-dependent DNA helicase RecG